MILKFPSGSQTGSKDPEVIAAMYFKDDGSWFMKTVEDIDPDSLIIVEDFVKFITFVSNKEDVIREFLEHQKKIEFKNYDQWRRENLKLVKKTEE